MKKNKRIEMCIKKKLFSVIWNRIKCVYSDIHGDDYIYTIYIYKKMTVQIKKNFKICDFSFYLSFPVQTVASLATGGKEF